MTLTVYYPNGVVYNEKDLLKLLKGYSKNPEYIAVLS